MFFDHYRLCGQIFNGFMHFTSHTSIKIVVNSQILSKFNEIQ